MGYLGLAILSVALVSSGLSEAYAQQTELPLVVTTDKSDYTTGDRIEVSGVVNKPGTISNPVIIKIQSLADVPKLIAVDQLSVAEDGTYSTTFSTGGKLWVTGNYEVLATYGSQPASAEFGFAVAGEEVASAESAPTEPDASEPVASESDDTTSEMQEPDATDKPEAEPEPASEPESQDDSGCLIATAAYGSELAPQVQFLREIRDNTLFTTASGTAFMTSFNDLYYSFSPAIADMERENPLVRDAIRTLIVPMLSTISIMTLADEGSESQVLGLGILVIALNIAIYVAAPLTGVILLGRSLKSKIVTH